MKEIHSIDTLVVSFCHISRCKIPAGKAKKYIDFAQPEEGNFTAVGMRRCFGLKEAVFLNGLNSHALDFDDGTNSGIIHLGSPIYSLLLPLAEQYDIIS